jgi:hypothetical protein
MLSTKSVCHQIKKKQTVLHGATPSVQDVFLKDRDFRARERSGNESILSFPGCQQLPQIFSLIFHGEVRYSIREGRNGTP